MTTCVFPQCPHPVNGSNRDGQPTCQLHRCVVVSGSHVPDRHNSGGDS